MTLKEFNKRLDHTWRMRNRADKIKCLADMYDEDTYLIAGVRHVTREPGFPCWTFDGGGWYGTPKEAMEAKCSKG